MRHAKRSQRLSRPTDQKEALVNGLLKSLIEHDRIHTTHARAKEAQPLADRLVTLGKSDTLHARRQAFRILQDRTLVKRLFNEVAPRFSDVSGGYTRVVRVRIRKGDGATVAQLAFSRIPEVVESAVSTKKALGKNPPKESEPTAEDSGKKGLLEGLRGRLKRKKKGSSA